MLEFGFGYNRINNFHKEFLWEQKSFEFTHELFRWKCAGPELWESGSILWISRLLYLPDQSWFIQQLFSSCSKRKHCSAPKFRTRGAMMEKQHTFGGNYSNRLFIGGTIDRQNIRYLEETTFEETDKDNVIDTLNQYEFNQNLTTHGFGFNVKFGVIYKAAD